MKSNTSKSKEEQLDKIIFRCFEQGHYWGELINFGDGGDNNNRPEPPKEPIDRTEALKELTTTSVNPKKED